MKLSVTKVNHISHLIMKAMMKDDNFDFISTENDVRLKIKNLILEELRLEELIDQHVRSAITSMTRRVPEGSKEWDILYTRLFQEEMAKRRI